MASGWRLVSARYAERAYSGEGARRHGARWNSPGKAVVYVAEYRSLCVLEILAHVRTASPAQDYGFVGAKWDDRFVERLSERQLPDGWRAMPFHPATAEIGDRWVKEVRSLVLAVPNSIIPSEFNYLINPAHPDFHRVRIGPPERFAFDARLL
ncbi:MAG: RES family NAD+ phosphorylase [Verrucomicrobiota bacterium]|nr:RES family NAD+ phosphorylase [Verrucomicrobiota bacterium]